MSSNPVAGHSMTAYSLLRLSPVLVVILLALSGCEMIRDQHARYSRVHDVPVGSALTLNHPLEVAAGKRNLYVQNGEPVSYWDMDQYYPFCEVILGHLSDSKRTVRPDRMIVHRFERYVDSTASARSPMLASMGPYIGASADGDDGGPSPELYASVLWVRSGRNPDLSRLLCGHFMDPPLGEFLTIDEIRKALGEAFTLELARGQPNP